MAGLSHILTDSLATEGPAVNQHPKAAPRSNSARGILPPSRSSWYDAVILSSGLCVPHCSAFWGLFYTMEAGAIMTILSQHGGNQEAAVRAASTPPPPPPPPPHALTAAPPRTERVLFASSGELRLPTGTDNCAPADGAAWRLLLRDQMASDDTFRHGVRPAAVLCCAGRSWESRQTCVKLTVWRVLLQGQALSQLKTLPQILLPTRFSLIKALMRHGRGLQVPRPAPSL